MLVDANILLYAVDAASPYNGAAAAWLTDALNGPRRIGFAWQTIGAFLRIVSHPRVTTNPLSGERAWTFVESWLASDAAWIPPATERTAAAYGLLAGRQPLSANLVPDAQLAALALEHGLTVVSADTDFARFPEISWINPLAPDLSRGL